MAALGLAFQGTRGLWEPDEGFYANPALEMLRSGDWWLPRLNGEPFLDKPPLVYWSIAAGMKLLGAHEWGARAGHALLYAATALLIGLLGARWWGRRAGLTASWVYATSFLPFLASNVLTPDTPLAFCSALAYYTYWRLEEATRRRHRIAWGTSLGAALGLGALAKGPAILVLGAPLVVVTLIRRRNALRRLLDPGLLSAGLAFAALAVPWYAWLAWRLPGAAGYLLDNQVLGRLMTATYARNDAWYGGLVVYLPTLLVGSLPWTPLLLWRLSRLHAERRSTLARLVSRPESRLLLAWFVFPLCVFVVARSRLPLYVLPLFAPISLAVGRALSERRPRPRLIEGTAVAGWLLALGLLKLAAGSYPYPRDSRELALELARNGIAPSRLIVCLDTKKNALPVYGFHRVEQVTFSDRPYRFYSPPETLAEELAEIGRERLTPVFIVSPARAPALTRSLASAGVRFTEKRLQLPYVLVEVAGTDATHVG
ncbi:MAG TPA: glycosyltransferase family 39 protein [Thermoanaerobaculia bacterium]|nr:glycosyltransferase family 39 protein [Thermoanaerobaculia bacterium]